MKKLITEKFNIENDKNFKLREYNSFIKKPLSLNRSIRKLTSNHSNNINKSVKNSVYSNKDNSEYNNEERELISNNDDDINKD